MPTHVAPSTQVVLEDIQVTSPYTIDADWVLGGWLRKVCALLLSAYVCIVIARVQPIVCLRVRHDAICVHSCLQVPFFLSRNRVLSGQITAASLREQVS